MADTEKKNMRKLLAKMLSMPATGAALEVAESMGVTMEAPTNMMAITAALIRESVNGNVKAIKALQRVIANGYRFTEPESVARAREKYMAENNTVISFYEECMCERPNGKICDAATTGRIYDVYRAWCQNNNNGFAKTAKEFRETLAKHLGTTFKEMSTHTNKGTFYKDLTITIDTKEQYKKVYGYDSTDYLA